MRNAKQAIAIRLSKARRAGVKLSPLPKGSAARRKPARTAPWVAVVLRAGVLKPSAGRSEEKGARGHGIGRSPDRRALKRAAEAALIAHKRPAKLLGAGALLDRGSRDGLRGEKMQTTCRVHVGTSGWYYKHWLGDFYPQRFSPAKMFSWYAREFHTVEINNSFYRLPEERTFEQWKRLAPRGFIFAVKASRFITHVKKLNNVEDAVRLFFSRAQPLGRSLGPVLFQLPPKWKANVERLSEFLGILPKGHRYVLEFRDESWSTDRVYQLLREHNVALCIHDWREMAWPIELTADFSYLRFHGSGRCYGGNYPDSVLKQWAARIELWRPRLSEVFIYFNNDIGGHAIRNARSLGGMLDQGSTSRSWARLICA